MVVSSYVLTAIGIPVYFHYCGGELEEINYVLKGSGCCGEEEDSDEDNGCCKNENYILKSNVDFTLKESNTSAFVKLFSQLFFLSLPFSLSPDTSASVLLCQYTIFSPPERQQQGIIATTVLRI